MYRKILYKEVDVSTDSMIRGISFIGVLQYGGYVLLLNLSYLKKVWSNKCNDTFVYKQKRKLSRLKEFRTKANVRNNSSSIVSENFYEKILSNVNSQFT